MIEFKAECGHTVRARDEDSGGIVRCSYCGKPANVPEAKDGDLDFLFSDIEDPDDGRGRAKRRRGIFGKKLFRARRRRPGQTGPFGAVLRLFYATTLIIIVIVVSRKFVIPLFQGETPTPQSSRAPREETPPPESEPEVPKQTVSTRPGLIARVARDVIYVSSIPPTVTVCFIKTSNAPPEGTRIYREKKSQTCKDGLCKPKTRQPNESYVVEVALPINDRYVKRYPKYDDFRRRLDRASAVQTRRLANDYFIPDEGDVFVDRTPDQNFIVRQYRNVVIRGGKPGSVRALFLPRIAKAGKRGFSIGRLFEKGFIPEGQKYSFDVADVEDELEFYRVERADWPHIVEALRRMGAISYLTQDNTTRLFKIDIHNGAFAAPVIRDGGA